MIIQNEAQCAKCKAIIFSRHRHDFVTCECGAIAVDGGMAYLKRVGKPEDFIDRSMEMDSKIVDACVNAVKESIESNRNELGIALAVIRALRDNDCLSLEKLECAMTREEVIGLARAAGLEGPMETGILEDGERFTSPFCYSPTPANCGWRLGDGVFMDDLENFTALVTAAEREVMNKEFEKLLSAAIKAEREACAQICDENARYWASCPDRRAAEGSRICGEDIRARGKNET